MQTLRPLFNRVYTLQLSGDNRNLCPAPNFRRKILPNFIANSFTRSVLILSEPSKRETISPLGPPLAEKHTGNHQSAVFGLGNQPLSTTHLRLQCLFGLVRVSSPYPPPTYGCGVCLHGKIKVKISFTYTLIYIFFKLLNSGI